MTSLPSSLGGGPISEDVCGLLFLINGILCLFVVEAVRRPTIVSVSIPLRGATRLGLVLSMPALSLHRQLETIDELVHMPGWAWILVASTLAFLISRLHGPAVRPRLPPRRIAFRRDPSADGARRQPG